MNQILTVSHLGRQSYEPVWQAMKRFTEQRSPQTPDELWFVEHDPVFTLGQAGKLEHVLNPGDIPVIKVDRGGQVTYHGPGQLVVYVLFDVRRSGSGPRKLVTVLENSVISLLDRYSIEAYAKPGAPGVYVNNAKIASLGLRFKKMCSYHGVSLNVDMQLEPFQRINPCGYPGQRVTSLKALYPEITPDKVARAFLQCLMAELNCYDDYCYNSDSIFSRLLTPTNNINSQQVSDSI